jgi:hypothetical protein
MRKNSMGTGIQSPTITSRLVRLTSTRSPTAMLRMRRLTSLDTIIRTGTRAVGEGG